MVLLTSGENFSSALLVRSLQFNESDVVFWPGFQLARFVFLFTLLSSTLQIVLHLDFIGAKPGHENWNPTYHNLVLTSRLTIITLLLPYTLLESRQLSIDIPQLFRTKIISLDRILTLVHSLGFQKLIQIIRHWSRIFIKFWEFFLMEN